MARVLLMGLFEVDILLKSNVKGGASKLDPTAERRQPLDARKLQALKGNYFRRVDLHPVFIYLFTRKAFILFFLFIHKFLFKFLLFEVKCGKLNQSMVI